MISHPLIPAALAMLAGVLAAWGLEPPHLPVLSLAVLAGAGLIYAGWRRGHIPVWLIALFCLLLGAGLLSLQAARELPGDHISRHMNRDPHLLTARVIKAPEPRGDNTSVTAQAMILDRNLTRGLVALTLDGELPTPRAGNMIRMRIRLRPFTSFANPGSFDYAAFMAGKGLLARGYVGVDQGYGDLGPGAEPGLSLWLEGRRQNLGAKLDRMPPGQGRELLRALILGQRGGLERRVRDEFAATGTSHLLAISGLHMAMVWGLAMLILRLGLAAVPGLALRVPVLKLAAGLALLPCLAYAGLAGWSTPTLRAFIMAACLVGALMVNRPYRSSGGLALAAIIIICIWPRAPLELSFQLSFTAVCCILLVASPLARSLQRARPASRLAWWILGSWLVSAVVGPLLLPLTMLHFHQIPWLLIPANLVAVPLVAALILPLALLGAGLSLVWSGAALALWRLAVYGAQALLEYISYLASPDWAVTFVAGPGPWAAGLFYALVLSLALLRGRWRWLGGGLIGAGLAVALVIQAETPRPDGKLTVWMLDVGSGFSCVARMPQGQVVVVDGGGWRGSDFDFGRNVLAPFLWSQGFARVELLASSSPLTAYAGGLPFVARWFEPGRIWTYGGKTGRGAYGRLLELAQRRNIPLRPGPELPRRLELGGTQVSIVWPPPGGTPQNIRKTGDRALWLGLGFGRTRIWLPGSNSYRVEKLLASELPAGGAQVLAAPRGGDRGSCSQAVLERLKPEAVLVSAQCGGAKALPIKAVMRRVRRAGAQLLSTKASGCLKLVSDGKKWRISEYL